MRYTADLHVHSKYAYACSPLGDLDHLAWWGAVKGLQVVATGDFTHPAWRAELKEKLVPAEDGLFRLKEEIAASLRATLPASCGELPRFILSVEISTIYRQGGKTRKIHHLIYVPDMDAMDRLVLELAKRGNLNSDGRPILGLDSRSLLEITLACSPHAFLIPAHIWTPWFAVLGSKSGYDVVDHAYEDLAHHVFAVETGLSSDPGMNWRVASLDRYRLISCSDAHSPQKLGREATCFDTGLDYFSLKRALETGEGYAGTMEFFPEEGKYHLDGHRDCGVCLEPEETRLHGGRCPACGKPLTIGTMHRVASLASRSEADALAAPPSTAGVVRNLVPLPEILSEIVGAGVASKKVDGGYRRVLNHLGSELDVLGETPLEDIAGGDYGAVDAKILAEGIRRLRAGEVIRRAGFDGEYGVIRLFDASELGHAPRKRRVAHSV